MPVLIEQEWYPNGMPKAEKDCHKPMTKFCDVFDWLMEKGLFVVIEPHWDFADEIITKDFDAAVIRQGTIHTPTPTTRGDTWHEAANAAIEKALELI